MIRINTEPLSERLKKIVIKYGYDPNEFYYEVLEKYLRDTKNFDEWYEIERGWVNYNTCHELYRDLKAAVEAEEVGV